MYGLLEHSSNYSDTTGSLWFYSKDKATSFNVDIANADDFKSFIYKAKLLGGRGRGGRALLHFLIQIKQMEFRKLQQLLFHKNIKVILEILSNS